MIIAGIPFLHTPKQKSVDDQVLYKDLMEFNLTCMLFAQGKISKKMFTSRVESVLYKHRNSRSALAEFEHLADVMLYKKEKNKDYLEEKHRKLDEESALQRKESSNKAIIDRTWGKKDGKK